MITAQDMIGMELQMLHRMQYMLEVASGTVASHALKAEIDQQIIQLDQLETQFHIHAHQRGWNLPECEPAGRWLVRFSFRRRKDPATAEFLLHLYTDDTIKMLKCYNRWSQDDISVRRLFQNHTDCYIHGCRQLQTYI